MRLKCFVDGLKRTSGPVLLHGSGIDTVFFTEAMTEVGKVFKAYMVSHLGDVHIRLLKQLPGPVESERIQIIDYGAVGKCLKFPVELGTAHGHNIAKLLDAKIFIPKIFLEGCMELFHETILHAKLLVVR